MVARGWCHRQHGTAQRGRDALTRPPNKVLFFGATRCDNAAITPPGFALDTTLSVEAVAASELTSFFLPPAEANRAYRHIASTIQHATNMST